MRKSENNCITNSVYNEMKISIVNDSLKNLLEQNGFAEVWMYPNSVNVESFIPVKIRLVDNFL